MKISVTTAFSLVSRSMNKMLEKQLDPYVGSGSIARVALRTLADSPETMSGLLIIWGAFAEPVQFEANAAESMMYQAAREWLALSQDDTAARTANTCHVAY